MDKNDFILGDSGVRQVSETGAMRDRADGKGRFDLITPLLERRLSAVYEKGAAKYSDRNWENGMPMSWLLDSLKRHINAYELICLAAREGKDDLWLVEHGVLPNEDHLAQAVWNLAAMIHFEELGGDNDLKRKPSALDSKPPEFHINKQKKFESEGSTVNWFSRLIGRAK